ncbi:MAG TPA: hypothetical protein VGA36_11120 [Nitriliruptorales bacterium]
MGDHTDMPSPLDRLEQEFDRLVGGRDGLALHGRDVGAGLPAQRLGLDELRCLLLRRSTPYAARDAALAELARRACDDEVWMVGLAGVLLPGLRRTAGRLASGYRGDTTDLDAEVLAGFVAAVRNCDLTRGRIAARLLWAAYRRGDRLRRSEIAYAGRHVPSTASVPPPRPWGHPDLLLTEAVSERVIRARDAELIGATRLGDVALPELAKKLGLKADTLRHRRRRAERRLVAWLTQR